jgi:hypothetical protein
VRREYAALVCVMPKDLNNTALAILLATISENTGIAVDELVATMLTQMRPISPDARERLLQTVAPKARQIRAEFAEMRREVEKKIAS